MPIRKVKGGFKWGGHGAVYPTREGAARQAAAAHAHGFVGKSLSQIRKSKPIFFPNEQARAAYKAKFPDADDAFLHVKEKKPKGFVPPEVKEANKQANARARAANATRAAQMPKKPKLTIDQQMANVTGSRKPSRLYRLAGRRIPGGRTTVGATMIAGGVGAGYGLASKSDNTDRAVATGAGAAGTYGLYRGAAYGTNMAVRSVGRKDPVSNKLMGLNRKKYGLPPGPLAPIVRTGDPKKIKAVENFYRDIPHGVKGAGTRRLLQRVYGPKAHGRLGLPVAIAGGAGALTYRERKAQKRRQQGLVMKSESVGFGKATNLKDYDYLPENVREDVGYGSIGIRRNPMSALDLFASSRIMAEATARASGERLSRRRLSRRAHEEMNYAGSRAMLYSPVGRGSVY